MPTQSERTTITAGGLTVIDRVIAPTPAERLRVLETEGKQLADQMVTDALEALRGASDRLDELSKAGTMVQVGIRERARTVSESLLTQIEQIVALRRQKSEA